MSVEKISLTSFRCLLFFFFAGLGCLLPFISLHLKSSGLEEDEIQLISFASPLFATLGPLFVGPLVDYLSRKRKCQTSETKTDKSAYLRTVLSATVLLSSVFYCLLLSVPIVQNVNSQQQKSFFLCNEHGASLVQEKCDDLSCSQLPSEKSGVASLKNCRFNCDYSSQYGYIESSNKNAEVEKRTTSLPTTVMTTTTTEAAFRSLSLRPEIDISNLDDFFGEQPNDDYDDGDFGSGEDSEFHWNKNSRKRDTKEDLGFSLEESPHICYDRILGRKNSRTCFVFTPNSAAFNVSILVKPFHEDDRHCSYPLGSNFSCRIPQGLEKPNESCQVVCDLEEIFSSGNTLLRSQCGQMFKDPSVTFWSYLTFRSFGDLFLSASIALFIGATLVTSGEEAGKEFILPSLAYGLSATVVGYLHSDDLSPLQLENIPNFLLGIVGFGFFSVLALFVLIFATNLSIAPPDWWRTVKRNDFVHKAEFAAVLFVLVLLGILWGPIYFHIPWHLTEPGGLELYVGCAAAGAALISVPFVWKAFKIVDYCGYSNVLIGAFTIYILRYMGLLFIENPWVLFVIGGMEAITLCLMLFSAVFYVRHLVPARLTFTSQSLVVAAHFCLGGGLGCLTSTLLSPFDVNLGVVPKNATNVVETELDSDESEDEFKITYRALYCSGAIAAAVVAVIYFFVYHCCLKKHCLAPLYRNDRNLDAPRESAENGMYTPLRVIRNGGQPRVETDK